MRLPIVGKTRYFFYRFEGKSSRVQQLTINMKKQKKIATANIVVKFESIYSLTVYIHI